MSGVKESLVPAVPKCDVFREGCDKKRHKLKQIFSYARASHSSQKCDKCDASHFLSQKKVSNVTSHGQSRDKPICNRSNLQQDELESTNITVCIMTEILIIVVLGGGVSCSKGCCRRFGRIFGICRLFEIMDNILTETLSMISNNRHVEQSSNFT